MTIIKEKLMGAIEAKNNDVTSFIWKFAKNTEGVQEEIRLIDATDEQLQKFYNHCMSMLYSKDKLNPGRYTLLKIIDEQRSKCNIELFLRKLETGELCANHQPYPRHLYIQDLRAYLNMHKDDYPSSQLKNISISSCTGNLPREFERISINDVLDGGLDQLGYLNSKHITFSFILNMGVYLTPEEMKEFDEKDENGNSKHKPEIIKKKLGLKDHVRLVIKPSGLSFNELRAMINLKSEKYSKLTTDQLTVLRNKVLFKLENEVLFHIEHWEEKIRQIQKVASERNLKLQEQEVC